MRGAAVQIGRKQQTNLGSLHHCSKLNEHKVRMIRELYASGVASQRNLATSFGVKPPAISDIILRKTWRHV